jgi:hypothetical protein
MLRLVRSVGALVLFCAGPAIVSAQHTHGESPAPASQSIWSLGAGVIPLVTVASPAVAGKTLTEGYLSQPMVMLSAHDQRNRFTLHSMLDFEGVTLERGELNAGMFGEGYVDRRHPHTYLHELVAVGTATIGAARASIAAGKGFVAFGTPDPMTRPFVKYPVNHHFSQILERALVTAAIRSGPVLLEVSSFNGDEPTSPSDWPDTDRFFDSWSARGTVFPFAGIEVQGSVARVKSPELDAGGGLDQRKMSLSIEHGHETSTIPHHVMVEWARSADYSGSSRTFAFTSFLIEGEVDPKAISVAARLERTERPEEERLANVFRTQRPATDFSILGKTRWTVATVGLSRSIRTGIARIGPFVEVAYATPKALLRPTVFEPRDFYGSRSLWSFSAGARLNIGAMHMSAGQYGAAARQTMHAMDMGEMR